MLRNVSFWSWHRLGTIPQVSALFVHPELHGRASKLGITKILKFHDMPFKLYLRKIYIMNWKTVFGSRKDIIIPLKWCIIRSIKYWPIGVALDWVRKIGKNRTIIFPSSCKVCLLIVCKKILRFLNSAELEKS